jgi:hypothetical protein
MFALDGFAASADTVRMYAFGVNAVARRRR